MPEPVETYFRALYSALSRIPSDLIIETTEVLEGVYRDQRTLYVIGNGQSATTASAFALDIAKQTVTRPDSPRFRVVSLTDNVAALTAWGNDVGYEAIFKEQLRSLWQPGDVLMAISASGNSPNVVLACEWVKEQGGIILGMTGFSGGQLRSLADVCVHVAVDDYGLVETAHIAVMHYWVDWFKEKLAMVE